MSDRQDPEYLGGFVHALSEIFYRTLYQGEPSEDPDAWAIAVTAHLEEAGWRMVTVKDWKDMTSAWMIQALR